MSDKKSNILLYGLLIGGLLGASITIYLSSRFIGKKLKSKRDRKHKFYEGIDDIFDSRDEENKDEDSNIDKETEAGIIEELFSRTN